MTEHDSTTNTARLIGTANRGYAQQAQEEIRRLIPGVKFRTLVPTETFLAEAPGSWEEVSAAIRAQEPIFLRHMQPVQEERALSGTDEDILAAAELASGLGRLHAGSSSAVQVRIADGTEVPYGSSDVRAACEVAMGEATGAETLVRHADNILSVYVGHQAIYAGVSAPEENLSDWSGGAIRFQREENQVSRAKFKLLEAERKFHLHFADFRKAVDVGAAPGGWTSLLLERGLYVTAIDPAKMHPSLIKHPRLTYHGKNAADVKLREDEFDLLVCDMSWSPRQMSRLILDLLPALRSGGTAIITAKLMHKKPFQTVKELKQDFEGHLDLRQAKQLFHNREELTLYFIKK
ncbi:SAM-dependent methyltransferase [Paenibacillus sp. UNC499MF]|uniref:SAM-dependent methyltransferase n=1 Tax=Paenibacillus sp. UNC499MF TaxID=1502751 RepID=UPI0008A03085|nr:SAM-dependent methyltransferase [Paenibacillus sp. UNC499MF]SEG05221.1 23S rRNA (cytidine2498-2'-O)-methyltransferase [Paenibacillus sp. UNC499MF]